MKQHTRNSLLTLFSLKRVILFSTLAMLVISSCRKTEKIVNEKKPGIGQLGYATPPSVEGGMLVFSNQEHYDGWIEYLADAMIIDTTAADTISQDSLLHAIELNIGFYNSLRQKTYVEFETLNEEGWATLEEIPNRHAWINSIAVMSTLNDHEEVKIGNNIISMLNADYTAVITDAEATSSVRAFKQNGFGDAHDIFLWPGIVQDGITMNGVLQDGNVMLRSDNDLGGSRTAQKTTGVIEPVYGTNEAHSCTTLKVVLHNYYLRNILTSNKEGANYTVNWGDGTIQNLGWHNNFSADHIYPNSNTYTVVITASNSSGMYSWQTSVIPPNRCARNDNKDERWYYPGPGWAIKGLVEVDYDWGLSRDKKKAYSESYKWNNSKGKWQNHGCENLYVKLSWQEADYSNCTAIGNPKQDKTSKYNGKRVELLYFNSASYSWAKGEFGLYGTGTWYLFDKLLYPCQ